MSNVVPTPPGRLPHLAGSKVDSERLLQEMRVEQRSYMEEVEEAVAESEAATTGLDLRLMQLGNRNVEVDVEMADRQIRGRVVHVSGELVTVENLGGFLFHLRMQHMMSVRFHNQQGEPRTVSTGEPSTLLSKLRESWTLGERCTIGRSAGTAVFGEIRAVTESHIEVADPQGTNWLIPIDTIAWVGPRL